jgi:hypothetical protein
MWAKRNSKDRDDQRSNQEKRAKEKRGADNVAGDSVQ